MSPTPRKDFRSPPGQEDQSARLAASAEVDQVVDTPTLEQFQRWLENLAHAVLYEFEGLPVDFEFLDAIHLRREECELRILEARVATKLLMSFKAEHYK